MMNSRCLYFCPVRPEHINKWEYYNVDKEVLSNFFTKVIIKTSIWHAIMEIIFNRPKFVYCWWWHRSVLIICLSRLLGIRVVCTGAIHMFDESGGGDWYHRSWLARFLIRISLQISSANLFISKSQLRQVTSHLKVTNPILVKSALSYEWEIKKLGSRSKEIKSRNADMSKVLISNITWLTMASISRKNLINIIDGVVRSREILGVLVEMVIIGSDGGAKSFLLDYIKKKRASKYISIKCDVSQKEKEFLIGRSDVYIQPTYYEGFGNAVLEAMSCGVPAIVSCNTAQPEVVGEAGYILPEIDELFIAQKIHEISKLSIKEREQMIDKVCKRVKEEFSISHRINTMKLVF